MGIFTLPDIKTLQISKNWNSVIWIEDKQINQWNRIKNLETLTEAVLQITGKRMKQPVTGVRTIVLLYDKG